MSVSTPGGAKRLSLPEPGQEYDRRALIFNHTALEEADRGNFKKFEDVDLANGERMILVSANGTRWSLTVTDAGVLGTTAA